MRVPNNIIEANKYTSGNELYFKKTQAPYVGYYYIINERYYVGKEYKENADELITIKEANNLLFRPSTSTFTQLSGITSIALTATKITSVQTNMENNPVSVRYFSQKVNVKPTLIKEIDQNSYNTLQRDPLYITTYIGLGQTLDQAEKQMPGLKTWLLG